MKYLLPLILALLLAGAARAQDRDSSNPLYIAAILVDEPADADMADLCAYYGYTEAAAVDVDGYRVFTSPDGTRLRYRLSGPDNAPLITVEVNNLPDKKELPTLLTSIGFQPDKTPNTYLKGSRLFRRFTTCTIKGGKATLTKHLGVNPSPREGDPTQNNATLHKLRKSAASQNEK